jgi:hypothetical protein
MFALELVHNKKGRNRKPIRVGTKQNTIIMKKLIFAMSAIAFAFSSCQKQASMLPATSAKSADDLLTSEVTHYYHGQQVTHESEIASYYSDESAAIITDKIDGKTSMYYFDNQAEEVSFLHNYPALQPILTKVLQAIDMKNYAIASRELAHFKATGEISQSYTDYISQYKTRAGYNLRSGLNATGLLLFIPGPIPQILLPMDNNAESFTAPAGVGGVVFRDPLFGGPSLAIAMPPIAFVNLPLLGGI